MDISYFWSLSFKLECHLEPVCHLDPRRHWTHQSYHYNLCRFFSLMDPLYLLTPVLVHPRFCNTSNTHRRIYRVSDHAYSRLSRLEVLQSRIQGLIMLAWAIFAWSWGRHYLITRKASSLARKFVSHILTATLPPSPASFVPECSMCSLGEPDSASPDDIHRRFRTNKPVHTGTQRHPPSSWKPPCVTHACTASSSPWSRPPNLRVTAL